jgi:hypothetical protein
VFLLTADHGGGKSLSLVALPLESLYGLTEKEQKEIERQTGLIKGAIEELQALPQGKQFDIPRIRFVEEADLEKYLYQRVDEWNKSIAATDKIWWGFQDHTFVDNYKQWIVDWYKTSGSKDLQANLLTNRSETEKAMAKLDKKQRHARFWKKDLNFTSTLWANGDYLVMIYTNEHPFYLIEIHNAVLAHNLREVFKNLWEDIQKKS